MFRRSPALNVERLTRLLALFDAHGRHVRRNLEYSYIATSNHYLTDVVGLFWLGICLPELERAEEWREVVVNMIDLGAEVNEEEANVLVEYLAKHWPLKGAKPAEKPADKPAENPAPQLAPETISPRRAVRRLSSRCRLSASR